MVARHDGSGNIIGYHMNCRCQGHHKCTKELATRVAGGTTQARRLLKSWVLLGPAYPNRHLHMARGLRDELLQAIRAGTLMEEEELDKIAPTSHAEETTAPYQAATSVQGSQVEGRERQGLLGDRGDLSQELHDNMEQLARTGGLPITTLEQRRRNRLSNTSFYEVPVALLPALRGGYLHPNLPPPAGLVWRIKPGASWKLCARGG